MEARVSAVLMDKIFGEVAGKPKDFDDRSEKSKELILKVWEKLLPILTEDAVAEERARCAEIARLCGEHMKSHRLPSEVGAKCTELINDPEFDPFAKEDDEKKVTEFLEYFKQQIEKGKND